MCYFYSIDRGAGATGAGAPALVAQGHHGGREMPFSDVTRQTY